VFVLNPQSGTPIYRQIVNQTRRLISGGQLRAGEVMPSVRSLALEHAVNPMTISKAYAILEADGWLERNPGKPMTVALTSRSADRRDRAEALKGQVREIVLAARQLELKPTEVAALIKKYWKEFE
jgi:GntR family transcriptional regulator